MGLVLRVCLHDAAAAIFEHGLLGPDEEFLRTVVTFEEQAAAASESVFETAVKWKVKARQVEGPSHLTAQLFVEKGLKIEVIRWIRS